MIMRLDMKFNSDDPNENEVIQWIKEFSSSGGQTSYGKALLIEYIKLRKQGVTFTPVTNGAVNSASIEEDTNVLTVEDTATVEEDYTDFL